MSKVVCKGGRTILVSNDPNRLPLTEPVQNKHVKVHRFRRTGRCSTNPSMPTINDARSSNRVAQELSYNSLGIQLSLRIVVDRIGHIVFSVVAIRSIEHRVG